MRTVVICLSILNFLSCSNSGQGNKTEKIGSGKFQLEGKWVIQDIVFVGDPSNVVLSKDLTFYSLLGTEWKNTKGKEFFFQSDKHWNSTIFDDELNQKKFTYEFSDSLVLNLKGKELNFSFPVSIIDTSENSMTWDIGNDINLILERSK